jgi:hypothetical protein
MRRWIERLEAHLVASIDRGTSAVSNAMHQVLLRGTPPAGVRSRRRLTIETWNCALHKAVQRPRRFLADT